MSLHKLTMCRWHYFGLLWLLTVSLASAYVAEADINSAEDLPGYHLENTRSYDVFSKRYRRESDPAEFEIDIRENCSEIRDPPPQYNGSICELVIEECEGKYELFNYLEYVICGLGESLEALGFILLGLWLIYLLSLLSTTVDNYFVPVLHMLSEKLRLPPSIAGMTLLALGNGAPDIFVAFSALIKDDDLALVLGALMGAGLFITSVVLGTVLMVAKTRNYNIDKIDFMRDIIAYIVVLAVIVAVAFDGTVYLFEAILFPVMYIAYVGAVIGITFFRKWYRNRKSKQQMSSDKVTFNKDDSGIVIKDPPPSATKHPGDDGPMLRDEIEKSIIESDENKKEVIEDKKKIVLPGLTWPRGSIFKKIHCVIEWPFSLLRWLTIPPCCHDGNWSVIHFGFAVFSPVPMSLLLMVVASEHWSVFEMKVGDSQFPVPVLVVMCISPLCVPLFFLLSWKKPPNKVMQIVLMTGAFVMSICWLYLIADEVVSVLQALGLLASISTAILGLTVLAIGNSVADWVADTVVSASGKPEMALASCFGAPLITHVMGLSFAFLARMIADGGHVYTFNIWGDEFVHVKMAWIFLAFTLFGNAIVFPLFKFSPPKEFGLILMYVYGVFMVFSVLIELGVMRVFV